MEICGGCSKTVGKDQVGEVHGREIETDRHGTYQIGCMQGTATAGAVRKSSGSCQHRRDVPTG